MIEQIGKTRIYPLTDHKHLQGKTVSDRIGEAVQSGVQMIQLRDKRETMGNLFSEAIKIRSITREHNTLFIVNDRVDLAMLCDADGVHLGQEDLPVEEARKILGDSKIIGISTHSIDEVRQACETSADYLAFGPVYATSTKENHTPLQNISELNRAAQLVDRPLFAIGGITLDRLEEVFSTGTTGVAVISDIFSHNDAGARINEYQNIIERIPEIRNEL